MISSLALFGVLSLSSYAQAQTCTPCNDVHMFLARGNNEPYPGRQGALVSAVCDGLASCGYEDLIYSALYTDLSCQTTYDGAIAGISQMTAYANRCPNSKLILLGYSQGAQIAADIMGGGGGLSFGNCSQPATPAMSRDTVPGKNVVAALTFGNTRHTANQPYNYANGSNLDGLFPRTDPAQIAALDAWTGIWNDWCDYRDPICTGNHTGVEVSVHLGYYNTSSNAAASLIKSVASLTANSDHTTSVPISISGTAQDYATIPSTFKPTGTVTLAAATTSPVSCASSVTAALAAASTVGSNSTVSSMSMSASAALSTLTGSQSLAASAVASATNLPSGSASASSPIATDNNNSAGRAASNMGMAVFVIAMVCMFM